MAEVRIGVIGVAGRVGRMLVADIAAAEGRALAGGVARPGSAVCGQDLGELAGIGHLGIATSDNAEALLRGCDVAIEFTSPAATAEHAALAARLKKPLMIGTTGLHGAEEEAVRDAARAIPIVWAANTSLGINLLLGLVEQVASRLGPDWDIEIMEMHHRHKIDAPSGTALALGRAAAAARGAEFGDVAVRGRDGITGPRPAGAIGFAALAWRRQYRRASRDFRRARRAARTDAPRDQSRHLCERRGARRVVARRQAARPLRHERGAGAVARYARKRRSSKCWRCG